jgi:hypothetical protein
MAGALSLKLIRSAIRCNTESQPECCCSEGSDEGALKKRKSIAFYSEKGSAKTSGDLAGPLVCSAREEEPQQVKLRVAQVTGQREVGAQPRVGVLDQRTAARCLSHDPGDSVELCVETAADFRTKPVPALPVRGRGAG